MAAARKTKKGRKPGARAQATERATRAEQRVREVQRKLKKAKAERREAKKSLVQGWRSDRNLASKMMEIRDRVSDFLDNVVEELRLHGVTASYRVVRNKDMTIDAELRIPYPKEINTVDKATDLLNVAEESLDRIPDMQHVSVGFTLAPEVNKGDIRSSVLQYLKYQGELRLNPNYYDTQSGQAMSFQVAYDVLRNIFKSHGRLPTGMLIRFTWSPDGWLRRVNDYELRRKASGVDEGAKASKKKPPRKTKKRNIEE